jgi:predicted DNA-binding transcriptional regulator AlpA
MVEITVRTLERYIATGQFPAPMRIGGSSHCLRWKRSVVQGYLDKLSRQAEVESA